MATITTVFHSGKGHTTRMAEHVNKGVTSIPGVTGNLLAIDAEGNLPEGGMEMLAASDGIIFGSPTYMGSVSWQFKKFADATGGTWYQRAWKDKFAAGFTNSASMNGDKHSTLHYLITLAMQHGMLWIGTGMMPANAKASTRNDINYVAAFAGAMAQTPADAGVDEMLPGDLSTAEAFGARIGETVKSFRG